MPQSLVLLMNSKFTPKKFFFQVRVVEIQSQLLHDKIRHFHNCSLNKFISINKNDSFFHQNEEEQGYWQ